MRLFYLLFLLSLVAYAGAELPSGVPNSFSVPAAAFLRGGSGYQITVASLPTRLEVRVATNNPDAEIDVFIRFGEEVGADGLTDCHVNGTGTTVAALYRVCSTAPLRLGTYYIAVKVSAAVTGTIMAVADTGPQNALPARQITSGAPAGFNFGSVDLPKLYNGSYSYAIEVPAGATSLTIALATDQIDANVDLHVRRAEDVTGLPTAQHSAISPSGNESITINAASSPPLQPGLYYIALRVISNATRVTGAVTATLSTPPPATITELTSGAAAPFSFPAVATPTLLGNFRLRVPAGVSGLEFRLVTSTTGVNVDLYARFGLPLTDPSQADSGRSEGPTGDEVITRTATPFQPIPAGDYYVSLRVVTTGVAVNGTITGTWSAGATNPTIDVTPTSLDFGSVPSGQTRDLQLNVRNVGAGTLTISSIISSNPNFAVTSPAVPFSLGSSATQAVTIRFAAPSLGSQTGTLTIASNDPSRASVAVPMQGTGASASGPSLSVAPNLDFGTVQVGQSRDLALSIRNGGSSTLTVNSITSSNTQFSLVSAGSFSITANGQQDVTVRFQPTTSGGQSGTLTISSNDPGNSTAFVRVTGTGQAAPSTQCPPGPSGTPSITRGAVVNAASFTSSALPGGAIAKGGIFTVFGSNLGPTQIQTASRFPLETTLGCVSVKISKGGVSVDAIPLAVIGTQVNAIMPSNAPEGDVQITVSFNNRTSTAAAMKVVPSSFGAFTVNQNGMGPAIIQNFVSQTEQPINSPQRPARPRQVVTLWGTGLGPTSGADNVAPPAGDLPVPVEITVGGKTANKLYSGRGPCCAGLDQIVFEIPADAPLGCYVPVLVRAGGVTGNTVTMAISSDGSPCTDAANPLSRYSSGGKVGLIQLLKLNARLQLDASGFTKVDLDVGAAEFTESRGGEFSYNPITSLPPVGSCAVFAAGNIDLSGLLGGQLPNVPGEARTLNAGPALAVTGPKGTKPLPRSTDFRGAYFLGGAIPLLGPPPQPLYLDPGDYTITGPGGPDVGPFTAPLRVPAALNWTNRDQSAQVTRPNGVTLNWSGGDPASQGITILGGNVDNNSGAGAAFVCFADMRAGSFNVPASILTSLPPSNLQQPDQTIGFLAIGAGPSGDLPSFTATGLDAGYAMFAHFHALSVVFR